MRRQAQKAGISQGLSHEGLRLAHHSLRLVPQTHQPAGRYDLDWKRGSVLQSHALKRLVSSLKIFPGFCKGCLSKSKLLRRHLKLSLASHKLTAQKFYASGFLFLIGDFSMPGSLCLLGHAEDPSP
jgi:hypothetical protein